MLRDFNLNDNHPEFEASKAAEIFRSVDLDGRGVIDYTEFVAACLDHKVEQEESVARLGAGTVRTSPFVTPFEHISVNVHGYKKMVADHGEKRFTSAGVLFKTWQFARRLSHQTKPG